MSYILINFKLINHLESIGKFLLHLNILKILQIIIMYY
nr:MAG TPA: hypothetical protein [Caudoviricetes sp.]